MEFTFGSRLKHAWNAFLNRDPTYGNSYNYSSSYSYRPDRVRFSRGNEKSIVTSIYNRMATDAATIDILHVRLDKDGRYLETINSNLNDCLTVEANIDQSALYFKQDIFMSMLNEGCIAISPIDTDSDPDITGTCKIYTMRTGKIIEWYPDRVKINAYNDKTGRREDFIMSKESVAIVENPFYSIMNESNSTIQRLVRKLNLLDAIDEQSASGKLDVIIQLPYIIKSQARKQQSEERRKQIEDQLSRSKYGIAYTDGTERITQLNRPVENNLMKQIEYLTALAYSQLGLTQEIMNGTADEQTMINYYGRVIELMVRVVVEEFRRKFLSKTARTQLQSIVYFRDPFGLTTVNNLAEMADKLTRNEIMTSNEIRQKMGLKPSTDPKADRLINSNISQSNDGANPTPETKQVDEIIKEGEDPNGEV